MHDARGVLRSTRTRDAAQCGTVQYLAHSSCPCRLIIALQRICIDEKRRSPVHPIPVEPPKFAIGVCLQRCESTGGVR